MSRRVVMAWLCTLASLVAHAQTPATPETVPAGEVAGAELLTLEQALALALANNPGLRSAALQVERARAEWAAARTRRLPALDVDALAGRIVTPLRLTVPSGSLGTFTGTGPIPSRDTVLEAPRSTSARITARIAQPLSQLHEIGLGVRLRGLNHELEQERLRAARATLRAEVKRAYYGLAQLGAARQAANARLTAYRELRRVVAASLAREAVLPADDLEVQAALAAQEYEVTRLDNAWATQREQLNELLGRELEHELLPEPLADPPAGEEDTQAALERALRQRAELRQAHVQVAQAETDRRLKKTEFWPDVSLAFSYLTFTNVNLLPRNLGQVGLALTWEPFDWGRRQRELAAKTVQVEQARLGVTNTETRVRRDVQARVRHVQEARLLVTARALARAAARERERVATNRQGLEATLLRELLQARAALGEAEAQHGQALAAYWTARADLESALGEEQ
jgi:outer membrane protein TolC